MRKPNTGGSQPDEDISAARKCSYPGMIFMATDPVAFSRSPFVGPPLATPRLSKAFLLSLGSPGPAQAPLASCLLPFKVHRDRFGSR